MSKINKLASQSPIDSRKAKQWPIRFQAEIFKLMSDLLTVGFSVHHAVRFCEVLFAKHLDDIQKINAQLREGTSISQAFAPYVDDQIGMQLKLAEQHGQLSESLGHVSRLLAANTQRQEKIRRLMQYPVILGFILVGIVLALNFLVLPQIQQLTGEPTPQSNWWLYAAGSLVVLLVVLLGWQHLKSLPILQRIERLARVPIIGSLVRIYYGYYLLAALAIMAGGGLGTQEMLKTVAQAKKTTLLYQFGAVLSKRLTSGEAMTTILKHYAFVPGELRVLIETGKPQAEVVKELTALADLYCDRLTARFEMMMTWIQPISFLILGAIIIGSYVSLFLPMYSMIGGIG
ncbi:type II secretion system F family protein [Secundilactobacillus kimchicus]|uniref:type II secretion system F family protein n=1 Tax=Secundilactobacillus kimchicus TaxID=528209 RepID=UPI0024A854E2|nr:type II secretion system F family protein [Secundilactobacillus kimchicus]